MDLQIAKQERWFGEGHGFGDLGLSARVRRQNRRTVEVKLVVSRHGLTAANYEIGSWGTLDTIPYQTIELCSPVQVTITCPALGLGLELDVSFADSLTVRVISLTKPRVSETVRC